MKLTLRVWRQKNADADGAMSTYEVDGISRDMSFLEMLDTLNEELILKGEDPVAFDHDCREGICGACSLVINGDAHGPRAHHHLPAAHAVLPGRRHHRHRAVAGIRLPGREGPGRRPLGLRPDHPGRRLHQRADRCRAEAHAAPVPKPDADFAFEHAECIGCGACVAACPNGAAMLFTSAKVNHLNVLPQGAPERETRVLDMVAQMDDEGFGGCTLAGECATACPKGIRSSPSPA